MAQSRREGVATAVFIELTTEAFEDNFVRLGSRYDPGDRAGLSSVRRPLRGLEVKEDTYAIIKVIRADGTELPLVDQSSPTGEDTRTASFILQQVQEARMEKHQIVETFGESYIFFFGESPRFVDVTAILINSNDFNWEAEWWHNWETKLRGTKTVEQGARTYLFYDDNIVEGYMLMAQAVKTSDQPYLIQLTFRMFVTNMRNVSLVGDPQFPIHASVNLPPNVSLTDSDAFGKLLQSIETDANVPNALSTWSDDVSRSGDGSFGTTGKLTDLLRMGSRSIAFPPDVQTMVDNLIGRNIDGLPESDLVNRLTSHPIRSLIADNVDEFTGTNNIVPNLDELPENIDPLIRSTLEVQDLFLDAIRWMSCFGANANSYQALSGLGLGVYFGGGVGVGIGFGASVGPGIGTGATFSPTARSGVGFGGTAGAGFGLGFGGVAGASAGIGNGVVAGPVSQNLFFGSAGASASVSASAGAGLSTGFGDPGYGYPSPFGGPGFGVAGFGDYGGLGYGSAFGRTGDPGYLDPGEFTFAGVEDKLDAFNRFVRPKRGFGAGFGGVGVGASFAGVGIGAAVMIGGRPSAFGMLVSAGTLDVTGQSPTRLNPFGVSCGSMIGVGLRVNLLDLL